MVASAHREELTCQEKYNYLSWKECSAYVFRSSSLFWHGCSIRIVRGKRRVKNTHMSENSTYTIDRQLVGNHLQVTLPELGIVLETAPGKIKRDDAVDMALSAISEWQQKQDEAAQVQGS